MQFVPAAGGGRPDFIGDAGDAGVGIGRAEMRIGRGDGDLAVEAEGVGMAPQLRQLSRVQLGTQRSQPTELRPFEVPLFDVVELLKRAEFHFVQRKGVYANAHDPSYAQGFGSIGSWTTRPVSAAR